MKNCAPILCLLLCGCATTNSVQSARDQFFERLARLCGQAFEGRIASPPAAADAAFAGKRLVMHVRDCAKDEIRIPFQVGEDRSRTWVISRTELIVHPVAVVPTLTLKHDHRHRDGSEDKLSQYGGTTGDGGSAERQEFPADEQSMALFVRENLPASTANVWAMEIEPGRIFAYELRRPGRFFRVEFDLDRSVAAPPPPWGARSEKEFHD